MGHIEGSKGFSVLGRNTLTCDCTLMESNLSLSMEDDSLTTETQMTFNPGV